MSTSPVLTQNFLTFDRPVGSGKTALTLALCQKLRKEYNIGAGPSSLRALGQMSPDVLTIVPGDTHMHAPHTIPPPSHRRPWVARRGLG